MKKETYYIDDLDDLLAQDQDCNFIAFACTTLQAQGIDAFLSYLHWKGIAVKGYIFLLSHPLTGYLIKPEDFTTTADVKILNGSKSFSYSRSSWKILMERLRYRVKTGRKVYIVWTEVVESVIIRLEEKGYDCYSVLIDDGGGSYVDKLREKVKDVCYLNQKASILKRITLIIKTFIEYATSVLVQNTLKKNNRLIDFRIFVRENCHLHRNATVALFYEEEFRRHAATIQFADWGVFEDAYLINTQCFAENKMTDGIVDLKLYAEIAKLLLDTGKKVVLKPHPRELNLEKYKNLGLTVCSDNTYPQEVIIAGLQRKPKCIISVFSSTLLNAYGLFDIPAISLAKLLLKEDISPIFADQLKDFIKQYHNLFLFPASMDDLKKTLNELP